jgi:4-diphosphocytidyl-2-C-methyl-D-erythritol kinase
MLKPNVHVSTAEAYAGIIPQAPLHSLKEILRSSAGIWKDLLCNDFEKSIFQKFPVIKELKEKLYSSGAVYAAMSGSGSTVFGLFTQQPSLQKIFKGVDYWEGELK